jgi:hypothetical protein
LRLGSRAVVDHMSGWDHVVTVHVWKTEGGWRVPIFSALVGALPPCIEGLMCWIFSSSLMGPVLLRARLRSILIGVNNLPRRGSGQA